MNTTPPPAHGQGCCNHKTSQPPAGFGYKGYGGHSVGETPGPIPNPEAKTHSADGTAPGRVWESRSPPEQLLMVEAPTTRLGPPTFNKQNNTRCGPSGHAPWRAVAGTCRPPSYAPVSQAWPAVLRHARDGLRRVKRPKDSVINLKKWRKHAEFAARNRPSW